MAKKDYYRKVYEDFKRLCAQGQQPGSFPTYCRERGLCARRVRSLLGPEYESVRDIDGYTWQKSTSSEGQYLQLYEDFKALCGNGQQPGSFGAYCEGFGFKPGRVYQYLKRKKLNIRNLPGYVCQRKDKPVCNDVPFEDIIFEEAGFLPADDGHVITVRFDGHVSVSFPAATDVDTIVRFVSKLGKEAGHVGS